MSLSTDVLSRATPTRLICRGGRWTLELTRLEAVDRDVFQPRLTRLEGTESILAALRRSDEGQHLVSSAAQIMRNPRGDEDRAFEVADGDWIPSADSGASHHRSHTAHDSDLADASRAVAELRAELAVLRASHARLRDRVIALEATQSGLGAANARPLRGSRRRRSEPPPAFTEAAPVAEPLGQAAAFAATQASAALAPRVPDAAPVPPPVERPLIAEQAEAAPTFEELAKQLAGEQPLPLLTIPGLSQLNDCLGTLMGSAPELEKSAEKPFDSLKNPQACKLLDDEGRERGAIIMDLKAAVLLGAALLALPRDEALRQIRQNDASEDALLAMSEICNNLTSPMNSVSGNAHVRSTVLAAVDVSTLAKPRARLDTTVDGGILVVAMF
jgi:hypothetical protein